MSKRILIVGHCGVDGPALQREIAAELPSYQAPRVNGMADLKAAVGQGADLLLVNREPVGFAPLTGVDIIRELKEQYPDAKALLVSDYDVAQEEAQEAGALPGFGKSDIGSPKFKETIQRALDA